jgi:hypothetical protein
MRRGDTALLRLFRSFPRRCAGANVRAVVGAGDEWGHGVVKATLRVGDGELGDEFGMDLL